MSMCRTLIFNFIHCSSFKFFSSTWAVKLHLDTQYSSPRWTERGCISSQPSLWRPAIYLFYGTVAIASSGLFLFLPSRDRHLILKVIVPLVWILDYIGLFCYPIAIPAVFCFEASCVDFSLSLNVKNISPRLRILLYNHCKFVFILQ